jgi:hypothetical protein
MLGSHLELMHFTESQLGNTYAHSLSGRRNQAYRCRALLIVEYFDVFKDTDSNFIS